MTFSQLIACGIPNDKAGIFFGPLNIALSKYEINTPLRISHFLSQIIHESGSFHYVEEIADGSDYEGRSDLGNTEAGDGKKFKGRGLIQITGRKNYTSYGKAVGIDFTSNPQMLSQPEFATDSAGWFWSTNKLNKLADEDNCIAITRKINGGLNGYGDRFHRLQICKKIFCK